LQPLARTLRAATGGNPAVLSEVLFDLFDRGSIRFVDDGLSFAAIDAAALGAPSAILEARAGRLPADASHALAVLLAGGGALERSVLFEEGEVEPHGFAVLREMGWASGPDRAGLIRLRGDLPRSLARFPPPSQAICGALADALVARGAPPESRASLLFQAGRGREGVAAALAGAERLRAAHASGRAATLLRDALAASGMEPNLRLALAEVHLAAGEPLAAVEALSPFALPNSFSTGVRATAARALGEARALLGMTEEALRSLAEARSLLPAPSPSERLRRIRAEAYVHFKRGAFQEAESVLREAVRDATGVEKERLRLAIAAQQLSRGHLEGVREVLEEIVVRLREAGNEVGTAQA
ncbi:MAG: tetratricopeptide repeat protein, partial [Planctomycetota bacterium]